MVKRSGLGVALIVRFVELLDDTVDPPALLSDWHVVRLPFRQASVVRQQELRLPDQVSLIRRR